MLAFFGLAERPENVFGRGVQPGTHPFKLSNNFKKKGNHYIASFPSACPDPFRYTDLLLLLEVLRFLAGPLALKMCFGEAFSLGEGPIPIFE